MQNRIVSCLAALAAACLALAPAAAAAWAVGGHSYIALHTDKKGGQLDADALCNRVYGSMAVDLFNYDFSEAGTALQGILHGRGNATAAGIWDVANGFGDATPAELAMAFGFASHNDGWGTDFVAHWSSRTLDHAEGYVVQKARVLAALLPPAVAAIVPEERIPIVTHILVEYAIDLLLAEQDPGLGLAMVRASSLLPVAGLRCETPASPRSLVALLTPYVEEILPGAPAEDVILGYDAFSRQVMLGFGSALAQPTADARRDASAALVAQFAQSFLGPLPPEMTPEVLTALVAQLLDAGKLVVAPDVMEEIGATIGRVNGKMSSLGISP